MFRIKMLSVTALAALSLAVLTGPALARGGHGGVAGGHGGYFGGYGGYFGGARFGAGLTGSYLPYRLPGSYGYYGLGYGGYGGYGLGYGGAGALGLGLGLRYGLGGYSGIGYGVGAPGYYYGSGVSYPQSNTFNSYPFTPLQPYGYNHPYGSGVYNYGGADPDFRQSMYAPPSAAPGDASAPAAAPAREETDVAHLQVIMPTANAQLWVNDTRTRQQGTERAFVSPTLKPGKTFGYELRARWTDRSGRQVEQSRSITVKAGDRQVIDFTRPQAEEQRQPAPERLDEQPPAPPVPPAPQDREP